MDSRAILRQELACEDSISIPRPMDADIRKPVKKDLSAHIEDNLSRLFECLKLEYGRRILVSPKWKNFGSQQLQLSEKTRLNNAIWRCWHIQYQKNKKPLFCQFVSPLSEERETLKKPLAIILQGRYWRRKLDAIAREYKKWRIYYKQKSQEAQEEAKRERSRTLSTSSGDDEVSHGSPLTQVVNLMDIQLTTDMVQSHPDTLFTTKTAAKPSSKQMVPEGKISEITFQPSLDSLQPNLDDFSKHIENLVDFLTQSQPNATSQLPAGFNSSRENLVFGNSQLTSLATSLPSQAPIMTPFQHGNVEARPFQGQPENVELMDHSQNYELYGVPTGVGQENQPIQQVPSLPQGQNFMDTTENFQQYAMDYDSQMEMQSFSPSSGQPMSHEGIPLEHLQEETEQELFVQNQAASTVVQGTGLTSPTQKSPLPILPQSSVQQIPGSHLQDTKIINSSQSRGLPYRHSSGNLQEYGTSQVRKGRLPRNVSDNQLSMIDSSQLGLGLSLLPSQETKIPTQVQFPNLVAHLQSSVSHADSMVTATKAKRPRIPRNMSDSGLYDMLRTSKAQTPTFEACLAQPINMATSPSQCSYHQTPLEQIQAQAAQSQSQLLPTSFHSTPASQMKHSSNRARKGKLPRNMSDSSLMYMSNQQYHQSVPLKGFSTHGKKSADQLQVMNPTMSLPSAHPVLSSSGQGIDPLTSLQTSHPVYASTTLVSSLPYNVTKQGTTALASSTATDARSYDQMSLMDQLGHQSSSVSTSTTVLTTNVQTFAEPTHTTSLLSQLLLQGQSSPETEKVNTKEHENQMMRQLLQVVQKQSQLPPSKQGVNQDLMLAALKSASSNQQSSELMSLLQGTSPQHRTSTAAGTLVTTSGSAQLSYMLSQQEQPQQQLPPLSEHQQQLPPLSEHQQQLSVQLQQQQQQQPLQHQQLQQQHPGRGKGKGKNQTTQALEQQLQQQLMQQQQQLQQQAQENQKTSQLISALKSTTQVLQQQLAQPQQMQKFLQAQTICPQQSQGTVFPPKPVISPRQSNIAIQPRPESTQAVTHKVYQGAVPIAPLPKVSTSNNQISIQPALVQPGQVGTADAQPSTSSMMSLQQMLEGNTSQVVLPPALKVNTSTVSFKASGELPQLTTVTKSSSFSFPQALLTTGTMTTATATTNEPTATGALNVDTDPQNALSPVTSPQAPKFTRPVSAADRENYKEHRRKSHITAEQKRRCNIKVGFDQLLNLVPSLAHQKNSKVSKATILQKAVEYTTKLQREREKMVEEEELLRKEIQSLHSSISACQQQLPASGVPVNRQRSDQMLTFYNQYVKTRTQENFKFWILSVIFRRMFEVYNRSVSTNTWEEFCANILSWLDEQCTLPNLRPAVLSALRDISRSTSILTDPSKFPDEIQRFVATNSDPTVIFTSSSPSSSPKRNTSGRNFFNGDGMS